MQGKNQRQADLQHSPGRKQRHRDILKWSSWAMGTGG